MNTRGRCSTGFEWASVNTVCKWSGFILIGSLKWILQTNVAWRLRAIRSFVWWRQKKPEKNLYFPPSLLLSSVSHHPSLLFNVFSFEVWGVDSSQPRSRVTRILTTFWNHRADTECRELVPFNTASLMHCFYNNNNKNTTPLFLTQSSPQDKSSCFMYFYPGCVFDYINRIIH